MPVEKFIFTEDRLRELEAVVPEAFAYGKINWDMLRNALEGYLEDENDRVEHFGLSWPGKRKSRRLATQPGKGTLIPAPGEGVNEDLTSHLFIEGDNLEVLKLLQKSHAGDVKMIYIDPPYNTGGNSIYKNDFSEPIKDYLRKIEMVDKHHTMLTSDPKASGRLHSNWLNMMYPRLWLAWQLLRDDGLIFISIDEHELANLLLVMDELFGEENREALISWRRRHNQPNDKTKMIAIVAEFLVVYAKNSNKLKASGTFYGIPLTDKRQGEYSNPDEDKHGPWSSKPWKAGSGQSGIRYTITTPSGKVFNEEWLGTRQTFQQLLNEGRIYFPKDGKGLPRKKYYLHERMKEGQRPHNFWGHDQFGCNQEASSELAVLFNEKNVFDNPKPVRLLKAITRIASTDEDLILDFFAGSCTTAQAVLEQNHEDGSNRRFIMVQIAETIDNPTFPTIAEIGKERIRRVIAKMQQERSKQMGIQDRTLPEDLGFRVFKIAHR